MRPTRRLSESSDEEQEVDDWGGGEVEELAVSISDAHMQSPCATSSTAPVRESEIMRRSRSPGRGGDAERSKDRSSSGSRLRSPSRPASRQSEGSPCSKSGLRSCSPSQPGSRSRSRSSSKQLRRTASSSSSSSGSRSSSGSSSSSSSDDSRMQSASQSSVR